ncbi:MAG: hypothetical protein M3O36_02100 [Myxococcota bacterium]|nr:hypothetical protein [Myxococcota bacterium]
MPVGFRFWQLPKQTVSPCAQARAHCTRTRQAVPLEHAWSAKQHDVARQGAQLPFAAFNNALATPQFPPSVLVGDPESMIMPPDASLGIPLATRGTAQLAS